MNIAIVGTGYVGLVSGTCFAEMGVNVTCVDVNAEKIKLLQSGQLPIYEPGLDEMVLRNHREGRLNFTTDLISCLDNVDIVFSAVGTPSDSDGSADLQYVLSVARLFGQNIKKYTILVTKSTVPVGTAQKVKAVICEELDSRGVEIPFDVASNPEFLKEGAAIKDFMSPDRVVVGVESEKAKEMMTKLYRPFLLNNFRVIFTDISSAEMIKYAANSMLATRISFMNDIANLCELVGADVNMVRKGIGSDSRIGSKFLYPGCGYGGSCFPKDVKALIKTAEKKDAMTKEISTMLCAKEYEVAEAVGRLKNEQTRMKSQIAELQQKLLKFCVAEIPVDEKIVTVFDGSLSGNLPREMMNQLLDKGAVICAVFAGMDEEGYRYVIGSRSEDVRSISKTLNSTLEGRGGGKPEMVQGSVKGTEDAVKEIIARYQ